MLHAQAAAAERRYLTIVFIDIVGYTELSERLDPEDLRVVQRRYQLLTTAVMERFGGFVAQFTGDGVLVYFGYPRSHGRDVDRACHAALELLERLPGLDTTIDGCALPAVNVRIGIHTGLVLIASEIRHNGIAELRATGEAVNVAARLQADARAGHILASKESVDLIADRFEVRALGPRTIRGLTRPMAVFEIVAAHRLPVAGPHSPAPTRMLGRDAMLARLAACWDEVRATRSCRVAVIEGDAGIGKTRLAREFAARLDHGTGSVLKTSCSEIFSSTALYGVITMLSAQAAFSTADDAITRRAKLDDMLDEFGIAVPGDRQLIAGLLGFAVPAPADATPTPELQRHRQIELVLELFERELAAGPLVLWVEDAHWLDPSSAEVLREIVNRFRDAPLLVMLTRRSFPVGQPLPGADLAIALDCLDTHICTEIAREVAGADTLPEALLISAAEAAEGIPLFAEQLTIALVEDSRDAPTQSRRAGGVPLLLGELMSERLDRRPDGRGVLQAAACIGHSFPATFLARVVGLPELRMTYVLEDMVAAELLVCDRRNDDVVFEFRHALIQRMAYESMVREQRQELHDRIATLVASENPIVSSKAPLLAHHLTEAGRHADAAAAWLDAGVAAARKSAHVEAVDLLRRALALLPRLPDPAIARELEIRLQATLMGSLIASQGATAPAVSDCCERGLALCRETGAEAVALAFAFGQFTHTNCRGDWRGAAAMATLFLELAERSGNLSGQVIGHRLNGTILLGQGKARAAQAALETSLRLYVAERDDAMTQMFGQNTEVHTKSSLSLARFCLGDVEAALAAGLDALRSVDRLRHPHSTAIPMTYVGGWVFGLADAAGPHEHQAAALLDLAQQHGMAVFRAHALGHLGWAKCRRGAVVEGAEQLRLAVTGLESLGFQLSLSGYRAIYADALRQLARLADARREIDRAGEELAASSFCWFEPEQRRISAIIKAAEVPDDRHAAVDMLRQAAAFARERAFSLFERRCLISCAELQGAGHGREETMRGLERTKWLADLPMQVVTAIGKAGNRRRKQHVSGNGGDRRPSALVTDPGMSGQSPAG